MKGNVIPRSDGAGIVIDIGSQATRFKIGDPVVKLGGFISIVGILGGQGKAQPSFEILKHGCVVQGILIGNLTRFEEMNQFIDAKGIKPVLDSKVWNLEESREAYQYLVSVQRNRGDQR